MQIREENSIVIIAAGIYGFASPLGLVFAIELPSSFGPQIARMTRRFARRTIRYKNKRGNTTRSVRNLMTRTITNLQKSGTAKRTVLTAPPSFSFETDLSSFALSSEEEETSAGSAFSTSLSALSSGDVKSVDLLCIGLLCLLNEVESAARNKLDVTLDAGLTGDVVVTEKARHVDAVLRMKAAKRHTERL